MGGKWGQSKQFRVRERGFRARERASGCREDTNGRNHGLFIFPLLPVDRQPMLPPIHVATDRQGG